MIEHEITIHKLTHFGLPEIQSLNRDLKKHREDGPAVREWKNNGILAREFYYLNGLKHREGDLPAVRYWHDNGNFWMEDFWLHGTFHRGQNLPARRVWDFKGKFIFEEYRVKGGLHRDNGPAERRWDYDRHFWETSYFINGFKYDPT